MTMCIVQAQTSSKVEICDEVKHFVFQGQDNWLFVHGHLARANYIPDSNTNRISELIEAFNFLGVDVAFVNVPTRAMIHNEKLGIEAPLYFDYEQSLASYAQTIAEFKSAGLKTTDLMEYINLNRDTNINYVFEKDTHWNSNGAALIAKALSLVISDLDSYQEMESQNFNIEITETKERASDILRDVKGGCGPLDIENDTYNIYSATNPNITLFGDVNTPSIPLWGTSYSGSVDFDDFLSFELGIDVINHAVNGGGLWNSLLSYFLNLEEDYPQIAIWEAPYWLLQEFNDITIYKEVIPTIYGACTEDLVAIPTSIKDISSIHNTYSDENLIPEFSDSDWKPIRATSAISIASNDMKLIFNGQKDPFLLYALDTEDSIADKLYEFSLWLWTDNDQPRSVAIYMYSGADLSVKAIELTETPTLYSLANVFSENPDTSMILRIDGSQNQVENFSQSAKGSYLYGRAPSLFELPSIQLITNQNPSIKGDDFYTHLEFDDLSVTDFELLYLYSDGSKHLETIERDGRISNNGKYFYELPESDSAYITEILLTGIPKSSTGNVSVQLCKKPVRN